MQPASAGATNSFMQVAQLESPEYFFRPKAAFMLCSEKAFLKEAYGWLNAYLETQQSPTLIPEV